MKRKKWYDVTVLDIKEYEIEQYRKAFLAGTDEAWKQYRTNVKKMVNRFNRTKREQIDLDQIMA